MASSPGGARGAAVAPWAGSAQGRRQARAGRGGPLSAERRGPGRPRRAAARHVHAGQPGGRAGGGAAGRGAAWHAGAGGLAQLSARSGGALRRGAGVAAAREGAAGAAGPELAAALPSGLGSQAGASSSPSSSAVCEVCGKRREPVLQGPPAGGRGGHSPCGHSPSGLRKRKARRCAPGVVPPRLLPVHLHVFVEAKPGAAGGASETGSAEARPFFGHRSPGFTSPDTAVTPGRSTCCPPPCESGACGHWDKRRTGILWGGQREGRLSRGSGGGFVDPGGGRPGSRVRPWRGALTNSVPGILRWESP